MRNMADLNHTQFFRVEAEPEDSVKKILEEDKLHPQPLFLKTSDNLILNIARMVVQEKKKTFLVQNNSKHILPIYGLYADKEKIKTIYMS